LADCPHVYACADRSKRSGLSLNSKQFDFP
jgi:hypothetical protein